MSANISPTSLGVTIDTNENTNRLENQILVENQKMEAPVYLLPSELLSWIFELGSWNDWKTPLRIGCFCGKWRYVVLNTPRAWCSIAISKNKPLREVYFERSGQFGLHIGSSCKNLPPVEIIGRIECMYLQRDDFARSCFTRLERLTIEQELHMKVSYSISASFFPILHHLDVLRVSLPTDMDCSSLPALESFSLRTEMYNNSWLRIIQGCTKSLVSLSIDFNPMRSRETPTDINLPKLYYLKISNRRGTAMSWLSFTAPALRVYIDGTPAPQRCRILNGLHLVTHLHLPDLQRLHSLGNICALQTNATIPISRGLLEELRNSIAGLPYLKDIQFLNEGGLDPDENEEFAQEIKEWNAQNNFPVTLSIVSKWMEEPPWYSSFPCGDESPCNPHRNR